MNTDNVSRRLSPIEKIHSEGMIAIIDGDNLKIIMAITPDDIDRKVSELEDKYPDVNIDSYGDIFFYRDIQ